MSGSILHPATGDEQPDHADLKWYRQAFQDHVDEIDRLRTQVMRHADEAEANASAWARERELLVECINTKTAELAAETARHQP